MMTMSTRVKGFHQSQDSPISPSYASTIALVYVFDSQPENQQACSVKTTIDLPADLVREIKLRAVHEGRKLKDVAAELLKRGLGLPSMPVRSARKPKISRDPITGFPVIQSRRSPGFISPTLEESLALIQQANQEEDLRRAGQVD
jgi:hypothetical protein